ncbi:MAG: hypothetical protein JWN95_484 [Frankiales bacterium]|nr:hypothetical protein [Frankiales bacterium]
MPVRKQVLAISFAAIALLVSILGQTGTAGATPSVNSVMTATTKAPPPGPLIAACGSTCNGKAATYVYGGSSCASDSSRVNGPFSPPGDPYMLFYMRYSSHCQTAWIESNNTRAIGRSYCNTYTWRYASPTYQTPNPGACDPAGGGTTYGLMVDDHTADFSPAAVSTLCDAVGTNPSMCQQTTAY